MLKKFNIDLDFFCITTYDILYVKGFEKEEYTIPLIREDDPRLKGCPKEGL